MSNDHSVCERREKVSAFSLFCFKTSMQIELFSISLCEINFRPMKKDINRLKLVLVERKRTGKWLAEQLGKDPSTVSKWCSNTTQPPLDMLVNIAKLLEVDIKELINEKDLN